MTLAHALMLMHDMGHVAVVLHRDHLCQREESHTYAECPAAPWFGYSAADIAELSSENDLRELLCRRACAHARVPWAREDAS